MRIFNKKYGDRTEDYFLSLDTGVKGWFVKTINDPLHEKEMSVIWESFGLMGIQHRIDRVPIDGLITISPGIMNNERTYHVLIAGSLGESKLLDCVSGNLVKQNKKLSEDLKEKKLELNMNQSTKKVSEHGIDKAFLDRYLEYKKAFEKQVKKDEVEDE